MTPLDHPGGTASARGRRARLAAVVAVGALLVSGCTADPEPQVRERPASSGRPAGAALRLVSFSSCDDVLATLKRAAKELVGPYGLGHQAFAEDGAVRTWAGGSVPAPGAARGAADAAQSAPGGAPGYSGTNTHEAGVEEPDLVKTDGRRIVTVSQGVLHVVDAQRRAVAGRLALAPPDSAELMWSAATLLLQGDRVLVLGHAWGYHPNRRADVDVPGDRSRGVAPDRYPVVGPEILLIDISGQPRLVSRHRMDGRLVDARQVGDTARVVISSSPRFTFTEPRVATDKGRIAEHRRTIDRTPVDAWLPRYEVTEGGRTRTGRVPCERLSHPTAFSGTSMLTVLTFDLQAPGLGDGNPITVVADGDTVYGTGTSLYVASDRQWQWQFRPRRAAERSEQTTEIFKFDTAGRGRPRFAAAGTVPGWLINQYAMSEWDGRLRVATTVADAPEPAVWDGPDQPRPAVTSSGVHVLRTDGERLVEEGRVTGLGKGERIYSVRFVGPVGYVVTFRQTDPLYTVDLIDPARPRVAGELKITGYSAYLHPAGGGRLIGVGQEATTGGQRRGAQVSLFDVSDLDSPRRLAQHFVANGFTEAEHDPHAFLYWPADRLLVMPLNVYDLRGGGKQMSREGALVLRVDDRAVTEVGMVRIPPAKLRPEAPNQIRRSLIIGDVLWMLSYTGLQAVDSSTLDDLAWVNI
jgi:uncharacterized secreted protein with C-terminal beta-propeller domain